MSQVTSTTSAEQMCVTLSGNAALAPWGANAILSFNDKGATIHIVNEANKLITVQKAARKLDSQGLRKVALTGSGWDLESIWAFYQGYREAKQLNQLSWPVLQDAENSELNARIKAANWTRDIINKSAEEVAPRQLATMAAEFIKGLAPDQVSYRIVKDKDLLTEGWEGIFAVGRGSAYLGDAATRLQPDW